MPCPQDFSDAVCKFFVNNGLNDPNLLEDTSRIELNDKNVTNARSFQVNHLPQIDSHLTAKLYVDNSIDEPSLVRNFQDKDFYIFNLTKINSITLNTQAVIDNQVINKAYVDQSHQENEQFRRVLVRYIYDESNDLVKNDQNKEFNDNKPTIIDSIIVNRNPNSDNEISNKK